MIISHVRLFMIISHVGAWKYQIYFSCWTWYLTLMISHIMFNTRNESGISAHPCIILYIYYSCLDFYQNVNNSLIIHKDSRYVQNIQAYKIWRVNSLISKLELERAIFWIPGIHFEARISIMRRDFSMCHIPVLN